MKTRTFSLLAALIMVAQGLWAQGTAMNVEALYEAVRTSQTVKLGGDFTLNNGRLNIDGTTVTLDLNGHTLTRPMTAADAGKGQAPPRPLHRQWPQGIRKVNVR